MIAEGLVRKIALEEERHPIRWGRFPTREDTREELGEIWDRAQEKGRFRFMAADDMPERASLRGRFPKVEE